MLPIRYEVVGEEDYSFMVEIESNGDYRLHSGTYTSDPPRNGRLTPEQEAQLTAAVAALGIPREHPMPEDGKAFQATLAIGEPGDEVDYPFWEGALEEDTKLKKLVRLLELL